MRAGIEDECITAPGCDTDRVRRRMGMVFQNFNLFPHLNIMKNITLAPVMLKIMTQEEADAYPSSLKNIISLIF